MASKIDLGVYDPPGKHRVGLWEVRKNLLKGIDDHDELRRVYNDFVDDVHDMWIHIWLRMGPHEYETGAYIASIKKKKAPRKAERISKFFSKGMPIGVVYTTSPIAHFIEYGTGPDNPTSRSPFGPNTPTDEFAPMRKTVSRIAHKRIR